MNTKLKAKLKNISKCPVCSGRRIYAIGESWIVDWNEYFQYALRSGTMTGVILVVEMWVEKK